LKPERWGSPLVQEKCREEKACDKRHPYRIIIITILSGGGHRWFKRNTRKEKARDKSYTYRMMMMMMMMMMIIIIIIYFKFSPCSE